MLGSAPDVTLAEVTQLLNVSIARMNNDRPPHNYRSVAPSTINTSNPYKNDSSLNDPVYRMYCYNKVTILYDDNNII